MKLLALGIPAALLAFSIVGAALAQPESAEAIPLSDAIDAEIAAVWKRDNIKPAPASTDEEFLRRAYLDTIGLPPTPDEVRAFLADKSREKRAAVIDRLLDDARFGRHMGDVWANIMLGRGGRDFSGASHLFAVWFAERVNANAGFDDIIYDVVTATGTLSENPAVAPYTRAIPARTADIAGNISRTMTGIQIQCAECHDHPYESAWTEQTFSGVASFFSTVSVRVNPRSQPADPVVADDARPVRIPPGGIENLPPQARERIAELARYSTPVFLDGTPLKTSTRDLWRAAMARWMTRDNAQTARYVANRFWSFAFGTGLVDPADDFNSFNEASHPELLRVLGQDLIDNGYDIKRLYRAILNSRTWQLSSRDAPAKAERWHFASAPVRRLSPEQFFGALLQAGVGHDIARGYRAREANPLQRLQRMARRGEGRPEVSIDNAALERLTEWYGKLDDGWYLRRSMAQNYTRTSSDDEMTEADGFTMSIDQALAVMNGDITNRITGATRGTMLSELLRSQTDNRQRLDELFLRVLSRYPKATERTAMLNYLRQNSGAAAWEDIMFALIAGTEFATTR